MIVDYLTLSFLRRQESRAFHFVQCITLSAIFNYNCYHSMISTSFNLWGLAKIGTINPIINRQLRIKRNLFRKPQVA